MCVYFVFELLLLVAVIATSRMSRKVQSRCIVFFGLYIALLAGLRGYTVGNDTPGYVGFFTGTNVGGIGYGTVKNPGPTIEGGFVLIGRFLSLFSHNGTFFLLTHALFVWMAIAVFYRDKREALWSLLLFMLVETSFVMINNAVRQSFSIGIVLWGFLLLKSVDYTSWSKVSRNMRFILGVACIVFAVLVHRTSIMLIPIAVLLYFVRVSRRWIFYTAIIVSFVLSQFFAKDIGQFFDTVLMTIGGLREENIALLGSRYGDSFGETSASLIRCLSYTLPCLLTTFLSSKEERNSYPFRFLIFWLCFYLLFNYSYMVSRLGVLFYVAGMAAFIPARVHNSRWWFAIYLLITLYYLWRAFVGYENWTHEDSSLPYFFFWE